MYRLSSRYKVSAADKVSALLGRFLRKEINLKVWLSWRLCAGIAVSLGSATKQTDISALVKYRVFYDFIFFRVKWRKANLQRATFFPFIAFLSKTFRTILAFRAIYRLRLQDKPSNTPLWWKIFLKFRMCFKRNLRKSAHDEKLSLKKHKWKQMKKLSNNCSLSISRFRNQLEKQGLCAELATQQSIPAVLNDFDPWNRIQASWSQNA